MYIFLLFLRFLNIFFAKVPIEYEYLLNWSIDDILTCTTILSQNEPESNGNEGVLHTLEPDHQM